MGLSYTETSSEIVEDKRARERVHRGRRKVGLWLNPDD